MSTGLYLAPLSHCKFTIYALELSGSRYLDEEPLARPDTIKMLSLNGNKLLELLLLLASRPAPRDSFGLLRTSRAKCGLPKKQMMKTFLRVASIGLLVGKQSLNVARRHLRLSNRQHLYFAKVVIVLSLRLGSGRKTVGR